MFGYVLSFVEITKKLPARFENASQRPIIHTTDVNFVLQNGISTF